MICERCGLSEPTIRFPWRPSGAKGAQPICLDCLNAQDAAKSRPPVPACPRCKRPDGQPHDHWCTEELRARPPEPLPAFQAPPMVIRRIAPTMVDPFAGNAQEVARRREAAKQTIETISFDDQTRRTSHTAAQRAAASKRRQALRQASPTPPKEDTVMPSATISQALNGLGINTASAALGNVPDPVADAKAVSRPCKKCKLARATSGIFCDQCAADSRAKTAATRAANKAALEAKLAAKAAPATPAPDTSKAEAAAILRGAIDLLGEPEQQANIRQIAETSPSRTQTADNSPRLAAPSPSSEAALPPMTAPAVGRPLAELRAELERIDAYRQELTQRIEEAEALEAFGDMTPAELKRSIRLAQLALARKGA